MAMKIIIEILFLWLVFALFMRLLVRKRGPIGGIHYYPVAVQERVVELGLISKGEIQIQSAISTILLIMIDLVFPYLMIVVVNEARSFWDCAWQYYVLFMGQELFDWIAVDVIWVGMSDWWIIPGTEDLNDTWHDPKKKFLGKLKLIPAAVPIAAVVGGFFSMLV